MDFENSLAYIAYPFYNWLAIHDAPEKVLDMFTPILCNVKNAWMFYGKEIIWVGISNWKLFKLIKTSVRME